MSHDSATIVNRAAGLLSLAGKVAIVTGAGSGIGRASALLLAAMGASVAVLDIDDAKGSNAAAEFEDQSGHAVSLKCDVRSASATNRNASRKLLLPEPFRPTSTVNGPSSTSQFARLL